MGVVARGCTTRRSGCQTARHRDVALAFALDAMDFWRSENGVYGLVAVRGPRRSPRRRLTRRRRSRGDLAREVPATACALGVEQRERDILPSSSIYGISVLRPIYIYIRSSAECASGPNNCFWKCEQRALINAPTVARKRSVEL